MKKVKRAKKQKDALVKAVIRGEQSTVPIHQIRANDYNYNRQNDKMFAKQLESIRRFGFVDPIVVREKGKGRFKYEVIDGEHRLLAARELEMEEVSIVNLGKVKSDTAKQLTVLLNELRGEPDEVRLAELLRSVEKNNSFEDLVEVMPYSERELKMFTSAIDFSFSTLPTGSSKPPKEEEPEEEGEFQTFSVTLHSKLVNKLAKIDSDIGKATVQVVGEYFSKKKRK